jgi:hypothetical protein
MACGSDVAEDADRCPNCGAEPDTKLFHENSDVRLEVDRLGELTGDRDLSLPAGRWGRASEHPKHSSSVPSSIGGHSSDLHAIASEESESVRTPEPESRELLAAGAAARVESSLAAASIPPPEPEPRPELPSSHDEVTLRSLVTSKADIRSTTTALDAPFPHGTGAQITGSYPTPSNMSGPHVPGHPTGSHAVVRPPVLASEALQRDLTPAEPAPRLLRFWSPALGLLGVAATWLLTRGHGIGAPLCGAFAALALLGVPRMPYAARAGAIATVAATGLAVVLWAEIGGNQGPRAVVLTLTVTLLAAGLFFRAWHRASALSRFMVALGILLGGSFLWMSGAFSQLTMLDTAWQSWAPRLIGLPFGILLMLSLLSFMNARTTAGAAAWGTFVLLWYALYTTLDLLHSVWPKTLEQPDFALLDAQTMLALGSGPIFSALLALSLAQLIAAGLARSSGGGGRSAFFEPIH